VQAETSSLHVIFEYFITNQSHLPETPPKQWISTATPRPVAKAIVRTVSPVVMAPAAQMRNTRKKTAMHSAMMALQNSKVRTSVRTGGRNRRLSEAVASLASRIDSSFSKRVLR